MKQGWEIKKLGEVCEIQGGSTPKRTESLYWDGGTYPWFTIEDIREQGRIITDTKQKVTKVAWDKLRVFPKGTVLLCCTASIGEYAITHIPITSNQQFNGLMIKDKSYLSPMYLMHYCATLKEKLSTLSGKATIDFVSAEKVRQIPIPVPPREEQERIVAELDCLSGVIEKKREQLRELDALAQSIFYTMFGDPNTNSNNLPIRKFSTLCENFDSKRKPITAKDRIEGSIPYYGASGIVDYVEGYIFDGDYLLVSEDGANLELRHTPIAFSIKGKTWVNNHAHILKFEHYCTQVFLEYYINLLDISDIITGCAQPKLTQANLNSIDVFDISIEKQQEFADKIEAIEKQKELIKQSITQTETLFNARMAYYFN